MVTIEPVFIALIIAGFCLVLGEIFKVGMYFFVAALIFLYAVVTIGNQFGGLMLMCQIIGMMYGFLRFITVKKAV